MFHIIPYLQTQKADGQILLNSITKLEIESTKDASYPLQVFFKGKPEYGANSPWVLDLTSNVRTLLNLYSVSTLCPCNMSLDILK